ncbi:YdcF family protein [Roseateles sp.]|uniref:YdcF family protein n=1 Tax=Roseateles sp. TaxID=1971397 RepID=UPI0031D723D5
MNDLIHAVAAFLLPPTGAFPLLLLAWWLRHRRRWLSGALFAAGLIAVWVGSTEFGALWLQDRLLGRQQAVRLQALRDSPPRQSVIVVLGGGARRLMPEYGTAQLKTASIERLRYGIWLSRQTDIPLLFTGGTPRDAPDETLTEAMLAERTALQEFGFTLAWKEDRATDTRENAAYTAELLRGKGIRRVILVTHDVHMRRAMRAFREALPPDVELLAAPMGLALPGVEWRDLLPSQEGTARARYLGYEWLGYAAGH